MGKNRKYVVVLMLLLAMVVGTAVVHALTIMVDGIRDAAWDSTTGQIPGLQFDKNEDGTHPDGLVITDGYDIHEFKWTNDQSNMYFLLTTYANTILTGTPRPTVVICLDMDNDDTTPSLPNGSYANCNNMVGIDRSVIFDRSAIEIYDGDVNTGAFLDDDGNPNILRVTQGLVTEVQVPLSILGLGTTFECNQNIRAAIYFDNGINDPDDRTPDAGFFTIGCGTPTAVSLQSFTPASSSALPVIGFVGFLALAVVSVGMFIVRREQKKA